MENDLTDTISHGSLGWSCHSEPIPVKSLDPRRLRERIERGIHKSKTGIFALCPFCQKEGRTKWIRVGIEEGGA